MMVFVGFNRPGAGFATKIARCEGALARRARGLSGRAAQADDVGHGNDLAALEGLGEDVVACAGHDGEKQE